MRRRNWYLAVFGLVVAIFGGISEVRGGLWLGSAAVVIGLGSWVIFSGSSFHWDHRETSGEETLYEDRRERDSASSDMPHAPRW
jgi:hypothetical protein